MRSIAFKSFIALVTASLFVGCSNQPASNVASKKSSAPIRVKTVSLVSEEIVLTTTQPATILPYYETSIQGLIDGYVKTVSADIGDAVTPKSTLAMIAIPEIDKQKLILESKLTQRKAQETQATAGVKLAEAEVLASKASLEQAKSEMSRVEASLAAAESEFKRTAELVARQSLEKRILEEVQKRRDSERASKLAVTSAINSAEANVTVAESKLASAKANVKVAKAESSIVEKQIEELSETIKFATLTAPFEGIVTQRNLSPGDLVQKGMHSKPLFVVSQINKIRVQIPVPEKDAAFVQKGDKIALSFPFFKNEKSIEAAVTRMSSRLDPASRTMLVEAEVENTEGKLIPGMFGQATIHFSEKIVANMLPARAIRFDESGNASVYIVSKEETVSLVEVTTGYDNGSHIQILSGLEDGQTVIDAHLKRFINGQKVRVLSN